MTADTPFWSAVKTGTSKDMRDNWCIGFSRRFTVGVWVGNFEGDAMHDVSGVTGAAPVWQELMEALHARIPVAAAARARRRGRGARAFRARGGPANQGVMWMPQRGAYELALEDAAGRTLDSARFVVR